MVDHSLMLRWVVGSIPHGGPIELFLVAASIPWMMHTKYLLLLIERVIYLAVATGFLSRYMSGPLS